MTSKSTLPVLALLGALAVLPMAPAQAQVHASGGATLPASGTITSSGGIPALWAETLGIITSSSPLTVQTTGSNTDGAYAATGGNITIFAGSTISATGGSSQGVWANGAGSLITLGDGVEINSTSIGIRAGSGASVNAQSVTITTTDGFASGVAALGGEVTLTGTVIINTDGVQSHGLLATTATGKITVHDVTIETAGSTAYGIHVQTGGQIIADRASVSSATANLLGLVRADSDGIITLGSGSQITTTGDGSYALRAVSGGEIVGDEMTVSTIGTNAHGVVSVEAGSEIAMFGSQVTTSGAGAYGLYAYSGGLIRTDLVSVSTAGAGAHGIIVRYDAGGGGTAIISRSTVTTTGAGADAVHSLHSLSSFDPNSVTIIDSTLSAAHGVGFNVESGFLEASVDNSTVTGGNQLLNVSAGALLQLTANNSTLTGVATQAPGGWARMTLEGSSRWNITGDSNLDIFRLYAGSVAQFTPPSSAAGPFKTLTVDSFRGEGGTVGINTRLGGDGSPSDQLILSGGRNLGSALLAVHNFHGAGDLTTGDGILVVGTPYAPTVRDLFTLAAPVIAGPYEYSLYRGSEDGDDANNWYLRSDLDCALDPFAVICGGGGDDIPDWRQEVSLYAAIPAMTLLYGRLMLDTLHERRGDAMGGTAAGYPDAAWGRVIGQHGNRDGATAGIYGAGPKYDYDFWAFQGGADLYRDGDAGTSRNRAGAFFAIGNGSGDVDNFDHLKAGENSFMAYSWGGYWTHYTPENAYIDALLLGTWYDIDANSTRIPKMKTHGAGFGASLEGGYPFAFAGGFRIEPQAQLAYQTISLDGSSDIAAQVQFSDVNSLAGRLGIRFAQDFGAPSWLTGGPGTFTAWVRPNFWYEFLGDPKTSFSSETGFIPFAAKIGGTTFEINTGFSTEVAEGTSIYANASYLVGISENADGNAYDGKVGVKVAW